MHSLELSILLHRALEARMEYLMGLLGAPDWRSEPEGVHQVRVASRRVRSVLALVRPELYPGFKRQSRRLRLLTRALGLTREMDVHALYLEELAGKVPGLATGSALEHALEVLEAGRAKARKAMQGDLEGNPLKHLPDLLKVPSFPDPFMPGDLATEAWQALDPLLDASFSPIPGLLAREDPPALHAVRIRVKGLRYALEVLSDAFPVPPETQLRQLKELQTALGEHHDRVMLESLLQEQYQGLALRGRKTLASGTLEVLAYVGEARLKAFERFRKVAVGLPLVEVQASLRQGLGLAEAARP
jgi:CHAD domain-containing protein